jgi:hypothetical protein
MSKNLKAEVIDGFKLNEHLEIIREEINKAFFHNSCIGYYKNEIENKAVSVVNALETIKKEVALAEKYINKNVSEEGS